MKPSTPVHLGLGTLLLAACLLAAPPALAQPRFDFMTTPGRLAKAVVPSRYTLELDVDPARDTFSGRVGIRLKVASSQPAIVLHANALRARRALLVGPDGRSRRLDVQPDAKTQTWRLVPVDGRPVAAGVQTLQLDYEGEVQRAGRGLYRAGWRDPAAPADAAPQAWLATQLEPVSARLLLPCFDEPAFRAAFALSVRAPSGLSVVANMPLADRTPQDGGTTLHRFDATPPMPSYLLALAVGQFDAAEARAGTLPLRVLTVPGKAAHAAFALQATQQLLPYYADYFGQPYLLPKLDQLAVPGTRWGAMEDWGLISYAESLLLVDPARSRPETPQRVFGLIAHEVAHQWFGNLVTAASWEEIWLNEAFATWMATRAAEQFHPEWRPRLQERGWVEETMAEDSGRATRAIRSGRVDEAAVWDVFDNITYAKGGAVLSMLEQWIGADAFQRGLAAYMAERRLGNATAGDLWHHIGAAAGRDVRAVAASWTDQRGHPLVSVEAACVDGATAVRLAQRRFTIGPADRRTTLWRIPVRLARGDDATTVMLDRAEARTTLPGCRPEPLVANAGGLGFYRVAYAPAAQRALAEGFGTLPVADRVVLLADAFALMRAGLQSPAQWAALLQPLAALDDDATPMLLTRAIDMVDELDAVTAGTPARAALHAAARALFGPAFARVGWAARTDEPAERPALREKLVQALVLYGDEAVTAEALRRFDLDDGGADALAADLRAPVYVAAARHGGAARWQRLAQRLAQADSAESRWTILRALASTNDPALATQLLDLALAGTLSPDQASGIPTTMGWRSDQGALAYRHVLAHREAYLKLTGPDGARYLLPEAARRFTDPAAAAALVADQAALVGRAGALDAARVAEQIRLHAEMRRRDAAPLAAALQTVAR